MIPFAAKIAGVGVGAFVGTGVAVGFDVAVGVGTGVEVGSGVTVGVGTGVEVGSGVTVGVGTGVEVGSGVAVGVVSGVKAGSEVATGSGDAVTGAEGLLAGCEHATMPTLTKQISAGRIRLCKKYLCFFIVGISVFIGIDSFIVPYFFGKYNKGECDYLERDRKFFGQYV